jgi:hypothetical protein
VNSYSKPSISCFGEMDIGRRRVSEISHFWRWFIEDQWSSLRASRARVRAEK